MTTLSAGLLKVENLTVTGTQSGAVQATNLNVNGTFNVGGDLTVGGEFVTGDVETTRVAIDTSGNITAVGYMEGDYHYGGNITTNGDLTAAGYMVGDYTYGGNITANGNVLSNNIYTNLDNLNLYLGPSVGAMTGSLGYDNYLFGTDGGWGMLGNNNIIEQCLSNLQTNGHQNIALGCGAMFPVGSVSSYDTSFNLIASFNKTTPESMQFDASGYMYMNNYSNFSFNKLDTSGNILATYSTPNWQNCCGNATFGSVGVDNFGNVYASGYNNFAETGTEIGIYKITVDASGVGNWDTSGTSLVSFVPLDQLIGYDNTGKNFSFDASNNMYVPIQDTNGYTGNGAILIIDVSGNVEHAHTDSSGLTIKRPSSVEFDTSGHLWVSNYAYGGAMSDASGNSVTGSVCVFDVNTWDLLDQYFLTHHVRSVTTDADYFYVNRDFTDDNNVHSEILNKYARSHAGDSSGVSVSVLDLTIDNSYGANIKSNNGKLWVRNWLGGPLINNTVVIGGGTVTDTYLHGTIHLNTTEGIEVSDSSGGEVAKKIEIYINDVKYYLPLVLA